MTELIPDDWLSGDPTEWLQAIEDPDVRSQFSPLLKREADPEAAAIRWIQETQGALLGADSKGAASARFQRVLEEVTAFVCGDPKYDRDREGLKGAVNPGKPAIVTAIAVAIGHAAGIGALAAGALFTVPVGVALYLIFRFGRKAWCAEHRGEPA